MPGRGRRGHEHRHRWPSQPRGELGPRHRRCGQELDHGKEVGGSGDPLYLSPGSSRVPRGGPQWQAVAVGPNPQSQAKPVVAVRGHRALQHPRNQRGMKGSTGSPHLPANPPPMLSVPGPQSTHPGAGCPAEARPGPLGVAGAGPQGEAGVVGQGPRAVRTVPAGREAAVAGGRLHWGLPGLQLSWGVGMSGSVRVECQGPGWGSLAPHSLTAVTCPTPG